LRTQPVKASGGTSFVNLIQNSGPQKPSRQNRFAE
jgi:hypothetical protein